MKIHLSSLSLISSSMAVLDLKLVLLNFIIYLTLISYTAHAQKFYYPSANLSTTWINSPSLDHVVQFTDGSRARSLLLGRSFDLMHLSFACGFYCKGTCDSFLFAIFIVQTYSDAGSTIFYSESPQVVWSANRGRPVKENATLQLTHDGDLVLTDWDGTKVWSTDSSGKSVTGMNITNTGNLVIFNSSDRVVWQSFDHPTDSLLLGQRLVEGQRLTASVSASNSSQGLIYLTVYSNGLFGFVDANPPQMYFRVSYSETKQSKEQSYVRFINGSFAFYILTAEPYGPDSWIELPKASSVQYMRLEFDGRLRVYDWLSGWKQVDDLLGSYGMGVCGYPNVCGSYGICTNGQCSCPGGTSFFRQLNDREPNLGCSQINPISCQTPEYHHLLDIGQVSYFNYIDPDAIVLDGTDAETCKQVCLRNCSCKAAILHYDSNASAEYCFLPSQVFSLMANQREFSHYNSSAFIKVQIPPTAPSQAPTSSSKKSSKSTAIILGSSFGALISGILIVLLCLKIWRKRIDEGEEEDDYMEQVQGMPMRFTYEDLRVATDNFCKQVGKGGFGTVFEGNLGDGMKVAVKRLEGIGQGKREFLAEVETIGSIHHVNLVRLVGFCADKSHRLLVYEYMSNGSLENWIFGRNHKPGLDWKTRNTIILDIAKGLSYLHEECRQKIVHLDIKPQNILLDDSFNAKVSDFGLSKLIDRDQSQVMTTMRGTPGYLAPEWLSSKITEKADVYSFGVVVVEIVCGRKNLDYSKPEESAHLLPLLQRKAEEDQLLDIVDQETEDMELHGEEAVKMLRIGIWCLKDDYTRRPSMSTVVKVLEGVLEIETSLDYNFLTPAIEAKPDIYRDRDDL